MLARAHQRIPVCTLEQKRGWLLEGLPRNAAPAGRATTILDVQAIRTICVPAIAAAQTINELAGPGQGRSPGGALDNLAIAVHEAGFSGGRTRCAAHIRRAPGRPVGRVSRMDYSGLAKIRSQHTCEPTWKVRVPASTKPFLR